jgi:hypothetical protein
MVRSNNHAVAICVALCLTVFAHALCAGEPLAVFEEKEILNLDWPRTVVTYRLDLEVGQAEPGNVKLVDEEGREHPCQLWKVELHDDGSIASARVSFMAELKPGGEYAFGLVRGEPAGVKNAPRAGRDGKYLVLENGRVGFRMPEPGAYEFDDPLRFGQSQDKMVKLYGEQIENGVAPGPFQGLRLVNGEWVGGSYFWAKKLDQAPQVMNYTCEILREGPVFAEARIRYEFTNGGWYQMTARLRGGEPWVVVDEQFDMGRTGNGYNMRLITSFTSGWKDGGWKPDHVFWHAPPRGGMKKQSEPLLRKLGDAGYQVDRYGKEPFGSDTLNYDKQYQKVFDVACWYPWHRNAHQPHSRVGVCGGFDPESSQGAGMDGHDRGVRTL